MSGYIYSTPVKAVDDIEEIDISQRGRLRKRRIIPNNVEDQYASKKPRQIAKSDSTPSSSEAVIVQQSKTELVEYADIIRQLQNSTGIKPLLIKSNRGGRTVLTSVMPVGSAASDGSNKSSAPTGIVQSLHFATPLSTRTSMPGSILTPPVSEQADHPNSAKVSQHPTIRTLLSASLSAASNKALGPLNTAVFISSKAAPLAVSSTGMDYCYFHICYIISMVIKFSFMMAAKIYISFIYNLDCLEILRRVDFQKPSKKKF